MTVQYFPASMRIKSHQFSAAVYSKMARGYNLKNATGRKLAVLYQEAAAVEYARARVALLYLIQTGKSADYTGPLPDPSPPDVPPLRPQGPYASGRG